MHYTHISDARIGENRGAPRLWLSTHRLTDAGFAPGVRFTLQADPGARALRIELSAEGNRRVSSKTRWGREVPIIDLNGRNLSDILGNATRVRTALSQGCIEIRLHPDDVAAETRLDRALARVADRRDIEIGSLCHGVGVLDHAIHQGLATAGISSRLAFALDMDEDALEASLQNNPVWNKDALAICAPLQTIQPSDLPSIDMLIAGLPCVGASKAGRAKNGAGAAENHATAGALFVSWLNIIKAKNPAVVVLENVTEWQASVSQTVIRAFLSGMGYELHEVVLAGNDMGALERRRRFCMVAVSRGIAFDPADIRALRVKEQRLGDVLEVLGDEDPAWRRFEYLERKEISDLAAGKNFRQQVLTPDAEMIGGIGAGYSKIRSTEPRIAHPTDTTRSRILSPREHARVKTVPEDMIRDISPSVAHRLLGNSVIHAAFESVGAAIGRGLATSAAAHRHIQPIAA
jgi:DNA (cytosine-5)-methyltransferase 1